MKFTLAAILLAFSINSYALDYRDAHNCEGEADDAHTLYLIKIGSTGTQADGPDSVARVKAKEMQIHLDGSAKIRDSRYKSIEVYMVNYVFDSATGGEDAERAIYAFCMDTLSR